MKLQSRRMLKVGVLVVLPAVALTLWLALQHNRRVQSSINSGRFTGRYESVMDTLHTRIRTLDKKLANGTPGPLQLLPEKHTPLPSEAAENEPTEDAAPEKQSSTGTIRLKGIYWSQTMPLADINGKLRKPGETVAGYVLKDIQPYHVVLTDPDGNSSTNSLLK